jgi:hypothetical protein
VPPARVPQRLARELEGAGSLETFAAPKILEIRDGIAIYDDNEMRQQPDLELHARLTERSAQLASRG